MLACGGASTSNGISPIMPLVPVYACSVPGCPKVSLAVLSQSQNVPGKSNLSLFRCEHCVKSHIYKKKLDADGKKDA